MAGHAAYLSVLLQVAEHDDGSALKLPHHPPEVVNSGLEWGLAGDVRITVLVALYIMAWGRGTAMPRLTTGH